jgi:hypothetical protein
MVVLTVLAMPGQASTVRIFDTSLTVNNTPALSSTAIIGARLGVWNGTSFTAAPISVASGYFDADLVELSASISASSNATVGINSGNLFALAIYNAASTSAYSTGVNQAVLTDASWIMPAFDFSLTVNTFGLTANTVAQVGSYNFNGGNNIIGLAVIPEPSSATLLALGSMGLWLIRRKKN